ncbi:MAG: zinc-ribbon domain-containing protein, partial [Candidatus Zixiibacteriota bacterium]
MNEEIKCRYCGADLKKGVAFCSACGNELQDKSQSRKREANRNLIPIVGFLVVFAIVYLAFFAGPQKADTESRY